MKKFVSGLLAAVLVAGLLVGCTATAEKEEAAKPAEEKLEDYTVKLGYYGCDHMLAAAVARDSGIYEELGLKVESIGGGNVPEAMAAGQMDVGYIGTEGLVRAKEKGSPIFVAANNHLGGSYYIVGSSKLASAKDLVGKKFGVGADADKTDSYWVRMAAGAGIPADPKQYEAVSIGGSDALLAIKNGQLDGFVDCDPWGSVAEVEGDSAKILAGVSKLPTTGDWGNCCAYSMNDAFASEHPEIAKKMILAHSMAIQYIYTNPVESAKIFAKEKGISEEAALRTIWAKTVGDGRTLTWAIDPQRFTDEFDYVEQVTGFKAAPQEEWLKTELLDGAGTEDFDAFIAEKVDPKFPLTMTFDAYKTAVGFEG